MCAYLIPAAGTEQLSCTGETPAECGTYRPYLHEQRTLARCSPAPLRRRAAATLYVASFGWNCTSTTRYVVVVAATCGKGRVAGQPGQVAPRENREGSSVARWEVVQLTASSRS